MTRIETYLGFDVGTKRTGVAIANSLTKTAHGLGVISHHQNGAADWTALERMMDGFNADKFIVGLPFKKNQKPQKMTNIARDFGEQLNARYGVAVFYIDEYLSSIIAKTELRWSGEHQHANRGDVDRHASAIILQTWMNEYGRD